MRSAQKNNRFRWTLKGTHYLILAAGSAAVLILVLGVM